MAAAKEREGALRTIERNILARLEEDGRTQFSAIGKRLRRSQQQVSYVVNGLVERGAVQSFYTIIDYAKLNLLHFRVYFHITYLNEKKFQSLIEELVLEPSTCWVATCGGSHDLICTFLAANPSRFNKTLHAIMERFPDQLGNYTVLTTVVNRHAGRKYLFREPGALKEIIFGGDREPLPLDEGDLRLLHGISVDARKSSVKLAAEIGVTPKTVIERLKRLAERKLILGYKPRLDPDAAGLITALLLVRYHNISSETEKELISYLTAHPNVVSAVKTLGEWDLEIEIEAFEQRELRRIEMEIRQRFVQLIQQIANIPLYRCFKKQYFPDFLLESGEQRQPAK